MTAPTPPGFVYVDPGPGVADAPDLPPFVEAFGATRRVGSEGGYELAGLSPQVGADALHQGPIQALLEAAALDAAREVAGTEEISAEHTGTTIVQRGKTGPFVATASVLAAGPNTVACRAELRDHGEGERVRNRLLVVPRTTSMSDSTAGIEFGIDLNRVVFFSDAVFTIAMTVLTLSLHIPGKLCERSRGRRDRLRAAQRVRLLPRFAVIGLYWLWHHRLFRYIVRIDPTMMVINPRAPESGGVRALSRRKCSGTTAVAAPP